MDLFPDLGEPGILDELFYFGPVALQFVLAAFFLSLTTEWMCNTGWVIRALSALGMVLATDLIIFLAFWAVFRFANPTLL